MCQLESLVDLEILNAILDGYSRVYSIYKKIPLASLATIYRHLKSLESKGYVRRNDDEEYAVTVKGLIVLTFWERYSAAHQLAGQVGATPDSVKAYVKLLCKKLMSLDYLPVESLEDTLPLVIKDFRTLREFKGTELEGLLANLCLKKCPSVKVDGTEMVLHAEGKEAVCVAKYENGKYELFADAGGVGKVLNLLGLFTQPKRAHINTSRDSPGDEGR